MYELGFYIPEDDILLNPQKVPYSAQLPIHNHPPFASVL
jgi:hypothetical protein